MQGLSSGPPNLSAMPDNPPCNTLFVGNLSDNINEAELNSIFSTSPVSLKQLKTQGACPATVMQL